MHLLHHWVVVLSALVRRGGALLQLGLLRGRRACAAAVQAGVVGHRPAPSRSRPQVRPHDISREGANDVAVGEGQRMHKAPASHTVFFAYVRVRAPTRLCQAHGVFSRKESCVYSDTQRDEQCPGEIATPSSVLPLPAPHAVPTALDP